MSGGDEVAEIVARLRQEVRASGRGESVGDGQGHEALPPAGTRVLVQASLRSGPTRAFRAPTDGFGGALLVPVKGLLRRFMRWYVEPPFVQQRSFNSCGLMRVVDELTEREAADVRRLQRRVRELEERLERHEPPGQ